MCKIGLVILNIFSNTSYAELFVEICLLFFILDCCAWDDLKRGFHIKVNFPKKMQSTLPDTLYCKVLDKILSL